MDDLLFAGSGNRAGVGPVRRALDGWVDSAADGVPGPMAEHARVLADALDDQARVAAAWAAAGRATPPGTLMAAMQLSREWRDTWTALLHMVTGGADDPAAQLLAQLAAPLVGDTTRP